MDGFLETFLLCLLAAGILALSKMKPPPDDTPKLADLPAIVEKVRTEGKELDFALVIVLSHAKPAMKVEIDLQFSIEDGRIGFEWRFPNSSNTKDKDRIIQLAEKLGYRVLGKERSQQTHLRVEEGDLARLCAAAILDLCAAYPEADLKLTSVGYSWE